MLTIVAIGTPLLAGYFYFLYSTFNGKVKIDDTSYLGNNRLNMFCDKLNYVLLLQREKIAIYINVIYTTQTFSSNC